MRKVLFVILLAVVITGCNNQTATTEQKSTTVTTEQENIKTNVFELDGFKNIKFGMNKNELITLGFSCGEEALTSCDRLKSGPEYTLLGREADDITVHLVDNKVISILVMVNTMSKVEAVEVFKQSLGNPQQFGIFSQGREDMLNYLWVSSDQTSIRIVIDPAEPNQTLVVHYDDKAQTSKTLNLAKKWMEQRLIDKATTNPKDY
jgi:hypothetical protein